MVLTTHAIVGASVAQFFPNHPVLAFSAGFLSHFILDALPHKDYELVSFKKDDGNRLKDGFVYNKKFLFDLSRIAIDVTLGFLLVYFIYLFPAGATNLTLITLAGAVGGVLPDALQFVYFNFRHEPLTSLQKFHIRIQNEIASAKLGRLSQVIVVLISVVVGLNLN